MGLLGQADQGGGVVQSAGGQDRADLVPGMDHLGPAEDGIGAPTGGASHRPGGRNEGRQASGVGVGLGSLGDETGGHDRVPFGAPSSRRRAAWCALLVVDNGRFGCNEGKPLESQDKA